VNWDINNRVDDIHVSGFVRKSGIWKFLSLSTGVYYGFSIFKLRNGLLLCCDLDFLMSLKIRVISQADPITTALRCSAANVICPSDTCYALGDGTGLIQCNSLVITDRYTALQSAL